MQKKQASIVLMDNFFKDNRVRFFDESDFSGFVKKSLDKVSSESTQSKYIVDIGKVFETLTLWKNHFPKVGLTYKASSNLDELIIKLLNHQNVKFTTFSGVEIEKVISMGVKPENIHFSAVCKINRHLRTAQNLGVNMLTFSSENELRRIATCHPYAMLCLRLTKPQEFVEFDLDYATFLLGMAASLGMGVNGLHIDLEDLDHNNSLCDSFLQLGSIIGSMRMMFSDMRYVYIGSTSFFSKNKFGSDVITELSKQFCQLTDRFGDIEFFAESGDILLNSGTQLLCTVAGVKVLDLPEKGTAESFYYLNDGVYGSFSSSVYGSCRLYPTVFKKGSQGDLLKTTNASLWGPTCDSIDKICSVSDFPVLETGDVIAFDVMGAGCRSCATTFNGFTIPDVEYVVSYQWLDYLGFSEYCHSSEN